MQAKLQGSAGCGWQQGQLIGIGGGGAISGPALDCCWHCHSAASSGPLLVSAVGLERLLASTADNWILCLPLWASGFSASPSGLHKSQAVVTLNLESRYQFPKDSSVKILTSGLLGEQYIGLSAGGSEVNLKAGDKITMTQSAVVLEDLISQFLYSKAADGKEGGK